MFAKTCPLAMRAGRLLAALTFLATAAYGQNSAYALRFYGTGTGQQDRVRIPIDDNSGGPDASELCDVGAGSFTLDFWVRGLLADNASGNDGGDRECFCFDWIDGNIIVDRDIFNGSERDWGVSIAGGFVRFGVGRGDAPGGVENTIEGSTQVLDGAWHHVACVRDVDNGQLRIYVDGRLDFAGSTGVNSADLSYPNEGVPGQATPWGPYIVLGAEKHDAGPEYPSFAGYMDEFRVWNIALPLGRIIESRDHNVAPTTPGLVANYRFEEGVGTGIPDYSAASGALGQLIAGIPGNGEWVARSADPLNTAPIASGPLPAGFVLETVVGTGLNEPTVLEHLPDGRLLVGERGGRIVIVAGGNLEPTPLITIPVNTLNGERGLVGLTLDPQFDTNGHFYVYYTSPEPRNRVSRFTILADTASLASEVVIWQNVELAADYHHGGTIRFGPDGHLYIAAGDQYDSSTAQDLAREHGKILRLEPDGAIPPDNPFLGVAGAQPTIWAYGLRNPFRFVFDNGRMLIGNVGGNQLDSWEELEVGAAGANYGWPLQEGPECFISDCSAFTFPIYSYQHNDINYYRTLIQASMTVGPVYRATTFAAEYQGNLYAGDYANRWMRRLIFDGAGNVIADPLFLASPHAGTIVDLEVGPDGALYFVTIGVPWSGDPDDAALYRIRYAGDGNQAPSVAAAAAPAAGEPPLVVNCSSAGTDDPDDGPQPLSYFWSVSDGRSSTLPNPSFTFTQRGRYTITLRVDDGAAESESDPIEIIAGTRPTAAIVAPAVDATYRAGQTINFSGTGVDSGGGPLPGSAYTWQAVLVHSAHAHPFYGPVSGITAGSFVIPATGHAPENTFYQIELTVTDGDGIPSLTAVRSILPEISVIDFDTDPPGIPIFLDGEAVGTPRTVQSLVDFRHQVEAQSSYLLGEQEYQFACWSNGGPRAQEYPAPAGGGALTAFYVTAGGPEPCGQPGDMDGDADVDLDDLLLVLANFGASGAGLPGDGNGDGEVNLDDLLLVLANFGAAPPARPGDLNGDGAVDLDDLLLVLAGFGQSGPGLAGDADGDQDVDLDDLLIVMANLDA